MTVEIHNHSQLLVVTLTVMFKIRKNETIYIYKNIRCVHFHPLKSFVFVEVQFFRYTR